MVTDTANVAGTDRKKSKRSVLASGSRRGYTMDFKLQVMKEISEPDASVAAVAQRYGMNTNVIFRWRRLHREGRLVDGAPGSKALPPPAWVPVRVTDNEPAPAAFPAQTAKSLPHKKPGTLAITLPGGFTVRADADIDEAALRRVLRAVRDVS